MSAMRSSVLGLNRSIPTYDRLIWPVVLAIRALGGSASLAAIEEEIVHRGGFSEEQQAIVHGNGPKSEIFYRMQWALTYLKAVGASDSNGRGTHWLTEYGQRLSEHEASEIPSRVRAARPRKQLAPAITLEPDDPTRQLDAATDRTLADDHWKQELSKVLMSMTPAAFERLCQILLVESGFTKVEVTGRSGDGGIDGTGVLRIGGLLSFQVLFQCKRYRGTVGSEEIRNFRGAMVGRSDKGLFLTTGTFTADARREATRDGAPPLDLVDGDQLCDLLQERGIGVRPVTRIEIDTEFFSGI